MIGSVTGALFINQVHVYLKQASASYLDMGAPTSKNIVCGLPEDKFSLAPSPATGAYDRLLQVMRYLILTFGWSGIQEPLNNLFPKACPLEPIPCMNVSLPIAHIDDHFLSLHAVNKLYNPFVVWGWWFLVLLVLLAASILVHDLALLQPSLRPSILSLVGSRMTMPRLWRLQQIIRCSRPYHRLGKRHAWLWWLLYPFMATYESVVFMFIVGPLILAVGFLTRPVSMSRILVFVSGLYCVISTLHFFFSVIIWAWVRHDSYAVMWEAGRMSGVVVPSAASTCICHCSYPLRASTVNRLLSLAVFVFIGSLGMTLRALKGLRHARWANLIGNLYTVPIEVFPVTWSRPEEAGGGPIQYRSTGEDVQGEPAFDPFCLLDEQPESWRSHLVIAPVRESAQETANSRWSSSCGSTKDQEVERCCGFPKFGSAGKDALGKPLL